MAAATELPRLVLPGQHDVTRVNLPALLLSLGSRKLETRGVMRDE